MKRFHVYYAINIKPLCWGVRSLVESELPRTLLRGLRLVQEQALRVNLVTFQYSFEGTEHSAGRPLTLEHRCWAGTGAGAGAGMPSPSLWDSTPGGSKAFLAGLVGDLGRCQVSGKANAFWVSVLGKPVRGLGNNHRLDPPLGNLLEARPWLNVRSWAPSDPKQSRTLLPSLPQ